MNEGHDQKRKEAVALLDKRKEIDKHLEGIAQAINPKKAARGWKKVLREDLNIVI
jgi:hypothetical protein